MKKILFAFMAITLFACSSEDSAPADTNNGNPNPENPNPVETCDRVFNGSVELTTQDDVDAFAAKGYCKVNGHMAISNWEDEYGSDITSLSGLSSLKEVTGVLEIAFNHQLQNLHGLENLEKVRSIQIFRNDYLTTLEHMTSLREASPYGDTESFIKIASNIRLESLKGLEKIENAQHIEMFMLYLPDLKGLQGLKKVGYLEIGGISNIKNLSGLEALERVTEMKINANWDLETFSGLNSLAEVEILRVYTNTKLTSVQEITNFKKLSWLEFADNAALNTFPMLNSTITEMENIYLSGHFTNVEGLAGLTKIMNLTINTGITSLHGLENLTTLSGLKIFDCSQLTSLAPLSNVTAFTDHPEEFTDEYEGIWIANSGITSLEGLQNISSFNGKLKFWANQQLTNYCAVSNIVNTAQSTDIQYNAYNPTIQDIIAGNCSQP